MNRLLDDIVNRVVIIQFEWSKPHELTTEGKAVRIKQRFRILVLPHSAYVSITVDAANIKVKRSVY